MAHWAKLDGGHIARFGELTKREIQVICALFLCRNGDNNRCNPKRKTIGALAGIRDRANVFRALAGLESKGWILEDDAGEFFMRPADEIPPRNVVKLTTDPDPGRCQIDNKALSKRQQNVVKTTTRIKRNSEQVSNKVLTARAPAKKSRKPPAEKTRIPDNFELTEEMISWFRENVPRLRLGPIGAFQEFVNYWTDAEGKKALKTNWPRTYEVGMRKLLAWQDRDDAKNGVPIGTRSAADVGANDYQPTPAELADRERLAALPDCFICDNERWTVKQVDPDAKYSWEREQGFPCDNCRRDEYNAAFEEWQKTRTGPGRQ